MKTIASFVAVVATVLLSGCNRGAAESSLSAEPAATYNAARGLKITPFAREFIQLATTDFTAVSVPATAVLRTVQGTFVYVENGGWFLRTPVKLGATSPDGTGFALAEGLYEGDLIVTHGVRSLWLAELHFLRAGQACAHEG